MSFVHHCKHLELLILRVFQVGIEIGDELLDVEELLTSEIAAVAS